MQSRILFQQRKAEIQSYLNYLRELESKVKDRRRTRLAYNFRIAKASTFVMLYNLVESTTKACFEDLDQAMKTAGVRPADVTQSIRTEWIRDFYKSNKFEERAEQVQRDLILNLVNDVIATTPLAEFDPRRLVSANVDESEIVTLTKRIGLTIRVGRDGIVLKTIRKRRNDLAHGNETFANLGSNYTPTDLTDYCNKCFRFLNRMILAFEDYITNSRYK